MATANLLNSQILSKELPSKTIQIPRIKREQSITKKTQNSSTKEKSNFICSVSSTRPTSNYPLEIPKISRLVYKNEKFSHKRWLSLEKSTRSSINDDQYKKTIKNQPRRSPQPDCFTTIERETTPPSLQRWEYSERIFWKKRKNKNFSLIIIVFEGVLGDFSKKNIWDSRGTDMAMCPGWNKGLIKLLKTSFVALISSSTEEKIQFISEYFEHNNVVLDAIYKRRGFQERFIQDYSQILNDFNCKSTVVISSLGLEIDEIEKRKGWEIVYEPSMSKPKKILCFMCPDNLNVTTVLFPNPRAQAKDKAVVFTEIAEFLGQVLKTENIGLALDKDFDQDVLKKICFPGNKFGRHQKNEVTLYVHTGKNMKKQSYEHCVLSHIKTEILLKKIIKYN